MTDERTIIQERTETANGQWEEMQRLSRDLRDASRLLGRKEARYLTDLYYQVQEFRKASANQVRSEEDEPNRVLEWVYDSMRRLEENVKKALGDFAGSYRVGAWMQSLTGIGPVLSAGFLSHLDIRKAPTAGHFWRFAGLDPTVVWERKQKRPWNARLKVLCYKAEDCFVKFQNHKDDHYGQLYLQRKDYEQKRNDEGRNAGHSAYILTGKCPACQPHYGSEPKAESAQPHKPTEPTPASAQPLLPREPKPQSAKPQTATEPARSSDQPTTRREPSQASDCSICHGRPSVTPKKFGAETDAKRWYEQGKLPPAHIHSRAMRWTGKMFLAHLHHVMHVDFFGKEPPAPYCFVKAPTVHTHLVPVPNWPFEDSGKGLSEMAE